MASTAHRAVLSFAESGMRARAVNAGVERKSFGLSSLVAQTFATSSPTDQAIGTDEPQSKKGIFARAWDRYSPGEQQRRILLGERLFRSAQRRASDPVWYTAGHIGRDFRPRHAMLSMHVWFLHKRLLADSVDPHQSLLVQEELFDVLWNDSRSRIRAEGVNELTVNKHLKDVQQVTFQHCTHYDHAFTEYKDDPAKRFEELAAAVWIHVLMKDEGASDDQIKRLAAYVEYQHQNILESLPDRYFREGRINWGGVPDFGGMEDNNGKVMKPLAPDVEDMLPGGWIKALTDAGDTYYWNIETNQTKWDMPTVA